MIVRLYPSTNPSLGRFINSGVYSNGFGDRRAEEVGFLMSDDAAEDMGGEVDRVEGEVVEDVVEEVAVHMKVVLTSQISPVTLKMRSRPYF